MKKLFSFLLLCGSMILGGPVFGQGINVTTTSGDQSWTAIQKIDGIEVSCFEGQLGTSKAVHFSFHNTSDKQITFSYVIKDLNGAIVSENKLLVINAGETLNGMKDPALNRTMTQRIKAGQRPTDLSITLTIQK